jgi:GNAT superfamily N-acetyltransferase
MFKSNYICRMNIIVRKSNEADMPQVLALIKELALYEKAPEAVINTVEDMIADGFGDRPVFFCDVAEVENRIVGIAVYFIKYSTWKGKVIYLDDIVVTEPMRGKGIGKKLFDHVAKESVKLNAKQLHWQVLDWNKPAINFYKKYSAEFDSEWINCRLSGEQLKEIS